MGKLEVRQRPRAHCKAEHCPDGNAALDVHSVSGPAHGIRRPCMLMQGLEHCPCVFRNLLKS